MDLIISELSEFMEFPLTPSSLKSNENCDIQTNSESPESISIPWEDGYVYEQSNTFAAMHSPNKRFGIITPPSTSNQSPIQDWEKNEYCRDHIYHPGQQFFNGRNEYSNNLQYPQFVKAEVQSPQMKPQFTSQQYNFGEINDTSKLQPYWGTQQIADYRLEISRRGSSTSESDVESLYLHPTTGKRKRTSFTAVQIMELQKAFEENIHLSKGKKTYLATQLNLGEKQIKVWFQNQRQKLKKEVEIIREAQGEGTPELHEQYYGIENINKNSGIQHNDRLHHYQPLINECYFQQYSQQLSQNGAQFHQNYNSNYNKENLAPNNFNYYNNYQTLKQEQLQEQNNFYNKTETYAAINAASTTQNTVKMNNENNLYDNQEQNIVQDSDQKNNENYPYENQEQNIYLKYPPLGHENYTEFPKKKSKANIQVHSVVIMQHQQNLRADENILEDLLTPQDLDLILGCDSLQQRNGFDDLLNDLQELHSASCKSGQCSECT